MNLVMRPVVCNKCVSLLRKLFRFKSQCLKVEENILRFAKKMDTSTIDLIDYCDKNINAIQIQKLENNNYYKGI